MPFWWMTPLMILVWLLLGGILAPNQRQKLFLSGCCGLLACLSVFHWQGQEARITALSGQTVMMEGVVADVEIGSGWIRHQIQTEIFGKTQRLDLFSHALEPLEVGQQFCGIVELEEADARYNGAEELLQGNLLELRSVQESSGLFGWAFRIRSRLIARMERLFDGRGREVLMGLLLGERGEISFETEDIFEKSGTAHLLTVSGFHISIMAGGIYWLLQKLGQKPKITAAVTIPLIFALALVEGWTVSVMRAAVMSALFYFAALLERDYDGLSAWGFALLLTLLPRPALLFSKGFLLSYSAVLGILLFWRKIEGFLLSFFPAPRKDGLFFNLFCAVGRILSVTIAANSLSLPFLIYFFGYVPLISLVSALLVLPLFPYVIGLACAAIFCPTAPVEKPLAWAAQKMAELLYLLLSRLAQLEWLIYGQNELILLGILFFYLLLLLLWMFRGNQKTYATVLGGFFLLFFSFLTIGECFRTEQPQLVSCRSSLVLTHQKRAIVVGAPEKEWDLKEIEKVLNCAAAEQLDVLFISRIPSDDGLIALKLQERWRPALTISAEELSAFDLQGASYQRNTESLSFWEGWQLKALPGGALLLHGSQQAAKLWKKGGVPGADVVFYDQYRCSLAENTRLQQTWNRQPKFIFLAEKS